MAVGHEGRGTVLVVDDEPTVLRATSRLLKRAGYAVVQADGVEAAFEALGPELIAVVSDVVMRDGDGFDIVDEIHERKLKLACVLMSGYPDRIVEVRSREGAPRILPKPFTIDELLEALERAIEAVRADSERP
jgi:DNA-binding NtrC family response regulator